MGQILLLAVAASWAAVLLPPLLRSRLENRPGSSVTDFRRQLSTLQRAVPTRSMTSMRSMGRPLASSSSPLRRPAAAGRPGQVAQAGPFQRAHSPERLVDRGERGFERSHGEISYTGELQRRYDRGRRGEGDPRFDRIEHREPTMRHESARRMSHRQVVRRRRTNVLFVLVMLTAATLFLAATTKSSGMVYAFAFAFVSLCGYCYKLAQLRQYEQDRPSYETQLYNVA